MRKDCDGHLKIAILPQFFYVQLPFRAEELRWTPPNRNFTAVFDVQPHVVNQHVFSMPCEPRADHSHRSTVVLGNPCVPMDVVMYEVGCKEVATHALVHRLLDRHEWRGRPEVHSAIDSEKNGLLEGGTRLESEIISKADVLKYSGSTVHFGSLMVIVSIKGMRNIPMTGKSS